MSQARRNMDMRRGTIMMAEQLINQIMLGDIDGGEELKLKPEKAKADPKRKHTVKKREKISVLKRRTHGKA